MSAVIFLMGPTASGKTDLAVELVARLPCDIISVDSAMVFRGMDIGTSKPGPEILRRAPHRLIDIRDPAQSYSAAQFRADALRAIADIHAQGRVPLLVGGTMLYFRALQRGLSELPSADAATRARIEAEGGRSGWAAMHARLARIDPAAARRIHPNDPQRIQRALEVYEISGRTVSELYAEPGAPPFPGAICKVILAPKDRGELHARIEARFRSMLAQGLIDEVQGLHGRKDLGPDKPSMRAVGYRQVWEYLDGRITRDEMERRAVYATRQLAKRQLTWLRSETDARWFDGPAQGLVDNILKYCRETMSLDY